jgi:hypothetical protein
VNGECLHSGLGGTGGSGGVGSGITFNVGLPGAGNSTLLGSKAKWELTLNVNPSRVRMGTKVKISGVVTTSPRPSAGKIVYVQARSVTSTWKGTGANRHRVTVYGEWITFARARAMASGAWHTKHKYKYKFHLSGLHTYEMQAVAPQEGGFLNPTGTSRIITITET